MTTSTPTIRNATNGNEPDMTTTITVTEATNEVNVKRAELAAAHKLVTRLSEMQLDSATPWGFVVAVLHPAADRAWQAVRDAERSLTTAENQLQDAKQQLAITIKRSYATDRN